MKVNGKEYKYSKVIDYSCVVEYDDIYFYNIEIIGKDLYLYTQTLWYPKSESELINNNEHDVFECIEDCLLVVKNFKVALECFEPDLKDIKNKLFYFFNPKRKKELQANNGKINSSFFDHFLDVLDGDGGAQIMRYNVLKKEISFRDCWILTIDNKNISGTANLSLKCDEFIYYWNECYSYKIGKKKKVD